MSELVGFSAPIEVGNEGGSKTQWMIHKWQKDNSQVPSDKSLLKPTLPYPWAGSRHCAPPPTPPWPHGPSSGLFKPRIRYIWARQGGGRQITLLGWFWDLLCIPKQSAPHGLWWCEHMILLSDSRYHKKLNLTKHHRIKDWIPILLGHFFFFCLKIYCKGELKQHSSFLNPVQV